MCPKQKSPGELLRWVWLGVFQNITGRIGSGGFQLSRAGSGRVGSGRVRTFVKYQGRVNLARPDQREVIRLTTIPGKKNTEVNPYRQISSMRPKQNSSEG